MRVRYLDSRALAQMEEDVACKTRALFQDREWRWPIVVDELLKMTHFKGDLSPVPGEVGEFQRYASLWLSQSAYTVLAVYRLWRAGHYVEAYTLLRHLYEVLAQVRFFQSKPHLLEAHLEERHVKWKKMFEELSPGVYDPLYTFLAVAAHGGATPAARAKFDAKQMTMKTIVGAEFEPTLAQSVLTLLSGVVLGFLDAFPAAFPENVLSQDAELVSDLSSTRTWLRELLTAESIPARNVDFFRRLLRLVSPEG